MKKLGRPEYQPDDKDRHTVMQMAGMGVPQDMIAKAIWNPATGKPISEATLTKYFNEELQCGRAKVMAGFCNALYHKGVVDQDMSAIRLFFTTQMAKYGWSEATASQSISAKNSDGGEVVIEVKFGRQQQDQDERIAELVEKRKGNGAGLH